MQGLALSLQQKQKTTQFQKLATTLLALQGQDLDEYIRQQSDENPLIEVAYPSRRPDTDLPIAKLSETPQEKLKNQLSLLSLPVTIRKIAEFIIDSLDEKGFFKDEDLRTAATLPFSRWDIGRATIAVRSLDPPGVGARSLCDSLIIQARRKKNCPPHTLQLLKNHYDNFLNGRWQVLRKESGITNDELSEVIAFLRTLSLVPLEQTPPTALWVRPEGELVIDTDTASVRPLLFQACPSVRFRSDLYASYHNTGDKPTQLFLSHAKRSYATLRSALAYRSDAIRRVLEVIATEQQEALLSGTPLQPLTQRDIALRTGLSETTVSRVCKNRYILFRNRTYKLQHFLSRAYEKDVGSSISDDEVKRKLLSLIDQEDRSKPYSDNALTKLLVAQNIPIARRTVTKLRLQLGIPNSTIRKAHNSNS